MLWDKCYEDCLKSTEFVHKSLAQAGIFVQEEKSVFFPVRALTWLGMTIDLKNSEIRPTSERIENTVNALKLLERKGAPSLRDRLKLTGQLASMWIVLGPKGSLFTKNLYHTICAFSLLDGNFPLSSEEKAELGCIKEILSGPLAKTLLPPVKVFSFATDASAIALGVVGESGEIFSRPLNLKEIDESSTFRELLGVEFGILCFQLKIQGAEVHVYTDNQNLLSILRKGSMISKLNVLAIEIHEKLSQLKATIVPHWVPREENVLADEASRLPDRDGWAIMPHVFDKVNANLGPAKVDRFASCTNQKLPRFNSAVPSPGSEGVDAFTQDWNSIINYCVPPIDLLYPTVTFILKHECTSILGFPLWPSLTIMPLLKDASGNWKRFITGVYRIPKGKCFLIPGYDRGSMFADPFLKSDFYFIRMF